MKCRFCTSTRSPVWWKCCRRHTPEDEVICQNCLAMRHPEVELKLNLRDVVVGADPAAEIVVTAEKRTDANNISMALGLFYSMVSCGEKHTEQSEEIFKEARQALEKLIH